MVYSLLSFFFPFSLLFFIILMLLTISYKGSQWSNQNTKSRNMKMSSSILIVRTQPRLRKSCYRKENWNRNILCPILKGKRAKDKTTQNRFVLFHAESVLLGRGYVWAPQLKHPNNNLATWSTSSLCIINWSPGVVSNSTVCLNWQPSFFFNVYNTRHPKIGPQVYLGPIKTTL